MQPCVLESAGETEREGGRAAVFPRAATAAVAAFVPSFFRSLPPFVPSGGQCVSHVLAASDEGSSKEGEGERKELHGAAAAAGDATAALTDCNRRR